MPGVTGAYSELQVGARAVATGHISVYIYPPKIRPGKFLWSKNDVLMVIPYFTLLKIYTSPKTNFCLRPKSKEVWGTAAPQWGPGAN